MTRLALALALGLAAPLAAQGGVQVSGGLDATSLHTASDVGSAGTKLSGVLLGGSGRLTYRALSLDLDYRQGSLQPAGGGISQEGVEGALLLGVSPRPWLTIRVGPHARTVADAAAVLGALTGVDPRDPATAASAGTFFHDYTQFLDVNGVNSCLLGTYNLSKSKTFTKVTTHLFDTVLSQVLWTLDPSTTSRIPGTRRTSAMARKRRAGRAIRRP